MEIPNLRTRQDDVLDFINNVFKKGFVSLDTSILYKKFKDVKPQKLYEWISIFENAKLIDQIDGKIHAHDEERKKPGLFYWKYLKKENK